MENIALLVEKSRGGDRDAFARIVEQYQGMVSAVTLNIVGDYAQSEDLAQETFLTAWKKLPELREPDKTASWFYGIAKRVALHWRQRQQKNPLQGAAELGDQALADHQAETDRRRQQEQSLELVWSTVKELPEMFREPLLLYYRYSKSTADIAESMELTEEAVRQRLSRGRKLLKAEVEKQVESVLEATKPGEYFVVGVLAAIPVLTTSTEVFAASSAAGSVGAAAKSGGGVPLLASMTVYLEMLANAVFFPLAIFFGVVSGAWNGVRNSPTLRSRRFMLKATVFQAMTGLSIHTFLCVFGRSYRLFISLDGGEALGRGFASTFFAAAIVFVGLYGVVSSYIINRRWRRIVEEDGGRPIDSEALERSGLSLRQMRKFLYYSMAMPFIAILPTILLTMILIERQGFSLWWSYFEYIPHIYPMKVVVIPLFAIMIIVFLFYHVAERMVVDEKSLDVWRPQLPNFLQVLTGEEKPQSGLRYRTNLLSDLLLVGVGLCMLQGGICANYFFNSPQTVFAPYIAVFVLSFIAYLLFALFFAGVPRQRYWGYIYFGTFMTTLNAVFVLFVEPWLYHRLLAPVPHWHSDRVVLALILFWLVCFIMSGVAGLLVFRKNPKIV